MGKKIAQQALAKLFMLTQGRVSQMTTQGVITKEKNGKYDQDKVTQEYVVFLRNDTQIHDPDGGMTMGEARHRQAVIKTLMMDLEYGLAKGELVRLEDVEPLWETIIVNLKTRLIAIPARVTPLIAGHDSLPYISRVVMDSIVEATDELATAKFRPDPVIRDGGTDNTDVEDPSASGA